MEREVLDEEMVLKEGNKTHAKLVNWISIIILWSGIVHCFLNGIITNIQVIAGLSLLIISTITTYFKYEIGVKITLGIITLGVLGIVKYSPISYSIGFRIIGFGFAVEMLIFTTGIIHYYTNRTFFLNFLNQIMNREVLEEEVQAAERSKINGFKNRFSKKSTDELKGITNNENLLPEARIAAKELVEARKKEANEI